MTADPRTEKPTYSDLPHTAWLSKHHFAQFSFSFQERKVKNLVKCSNYSLPVTVFSLFWFCSSFRPLSKCIVISPGLLLRYLGEKILVCFHMEITLPWQAQESFIRTVHFSSLHHNSTISIIMLAVNTIRPSTHWSFLLPACSPHFPGPRNYAKAKVWIHDFLLFPSLPFPFVFIWDTGTIH